MKTHMHHPSRLCLAMTCSLVLAIFSARGQDSFYMVQKAQIYLQTSSSGAVSQGYGFYAQASSATAMLRLPDSSIQSLSLNAWDGSYVLERPYASKAALDAAYPNGTYQMSGSAIPTVSLNLTSDMYPTATPSVIGGTWTNGVLVLNPAVNNTITISTNSSFATLGVAGHMEVSVRGIFDSVDVSNEIVSQAAFGIPVSTTPLTSITIPPGTLTSGKLYEAQVGFDTIGTLDTTTISGGGVVSVWSHRLGFYVGASSTVPAPTIATHPASRTGYLGGSASFTCTINVTGAAMNNTTSDWLFNGQRIEGLNLADGKYTVNWTNGTLTVNNLTAADFGAYALRAVNSGGLVTSNAATLSESTSYLSNLSVRTAIAPGQTVIVGFVVDGGSKPVLVRAAGPALTALGIPGFTGVTDPRLNLYNSASALLTSNDDWSSTLASTFATLGAFAFANGSKDAALLQTISGPHTAQATATNSAITLVEAYDAGTNNGRQLVNLSARFQVGTGDNILIAGFVLAGTGSKQLLIRAVGPYLSRYSLPYLADPQLAVFDAGTQIYSNNDWNSSLTPTFDTVGAFRLDNASKDAAILVTLPAGASHTYTVQVSGVGNTTGEALVEIYAIP